MFNHIKKIHKSSIQYSIAYNYYTQQLVEISEVTNENKLHIVCLECKERFIAVRNHQTPHFKHYPNSKCTGNFESYVHWITKEMFKHLEGIEIPELFIDDLPEKQRQKFQQKFNSIIDSNVPDTYRSTFIRSLKKTLSGSRKLLIDKTQIEKEFESNLGKVRVDIVVTIQGKEIFIEPFFSNQIDEEKKKKLSLINIATLSVDLSKFIKEYGQIFSLELLKKYLVSKKSKKWIYLSDKAYTKHIKNFESYLLKEIEKKKPLINLHQSKLKKILTLNRKRKKLVDEIKHIDEEIGVLENEIKKL